MILSSALLAVLAALPAAAADLTQPIRPGAGAPRTRDAAKAATAAQRTLPAAKAGNVVRAYQPAKPGEGAPKG
jgi:hypothetical protein